MAGGKVEELGDDRGGAEVDGHAEAGLRCERKGGVVGEDRGLPLGELELEVVVGGGATSEAPAGVELGGGESVEVVLGGWELALEDFDAAAFAAAAPAAGEFDAVIEEEQLEGGAGID
jgi:hypothetical protein